MGRVFHLLVYLLESYSRFLAVFVFDWLTRTSGKNRWTAAALKSHITQSYLRVLSLHAFGCMETCLTSERKTDAASFWIRNASLSVTWN